MRLRIALRVGRRLRLRGGGGRNGRGRNGRGRNGRGRNGRLGIAHGAVHYPAKLTSSPFRKHGLGKGFYPRGNNPHHSIASPRSGHSRAQKSSIRRRESPRSTSQVPLQGLCRGRFVRLMRVNSHGAGGRAPWFLKGPRSHGNLRRRNRCPLPS